MNPWLLTVRPISIPTDARAELGAMAFGLSQKEYNDKIWDARSAEHNYPRRVNRRRWPFVKQQTNVVPIKKVGKR